MTSKVPPTGRVLRFTAADPSLVYATAGGWVRAPALLQRLPSRTRGRDGPRAGDHGFLKESPARARTISCQIAKATGVDSSPKDSPGHNNRLIF